MNKAERAAWMRDWRKRNPDKVAAYAAKIKLKRHGALNRKYHLKEMFGLENSQIAADMLEAQDGRCAICRVKLSMPHKHTHVDHDPATEHRLRGILCHHCNVGLGHFKDRADLLEQAIAYLNFWRRK